jgi:hypothetical protein
MKNLLLFFSLVLSSSTFGQIVVELPEASKNELLSLDAYKVFKTNKFLDFKTRDTLIEIIDNTIYKKTGLINYFSYKKNWNEIEKENYNTYKKNNAKYNYTYLDSTMTESYMKFGDYNVQREINTVYNSKGFILNNQEKVFVGDNYNQTRIIINKYDDKNRITKIINRTERVNKNENKESTIDVKYSENLINISSENGNIVCKFITDANSIGFISELSPRETADYFMYSLGNKQFDYAKEYCTNKIFKELQLDLTLYNQIESVKFISGRGKFIPGGMTISDIWEIKFTNDNKKEYQVYFKVIKEKNGWKIDEFKILK